VRHCKEASLISATILDELVNIISEGMTTQEIDNYCLNRIVEMGGVPAPLFYRGFPKPTCTSLNRVICHGIPSSNRKLLDGDILNVDITTIINGWHGDTSRMYKVGNVSVKALNLCQAAHHCLIESIKEIKIGESISRIGKRIDQIASENNFSVVRDFCGHGVGINFHENPSIVHYYDQEYDNIKFIDGMIFTVEPMINAGKYHSKILADGWTAVTKDKTLSAQYEHTVYINGDNIEILTESPNGVFYS
jgi:methionyl aminopeptidase